MLANKLAFGVMGDYPLIVNGAKFQATDSLRSLYVAGTGYNLKGSGNGIVVPIAWNLYSIRDLRVTRCRRRSTAPPGACWSRRSATPICRWRRSA